MIPSRKPDSLGSQLLDECWEKLCNLPSKKVSNYLYRVISKFHCYGISPRNYYSKTVFDFVLKILSDEHLCAQRGIEYLVAYLCWDNTFLTQKQRSALLDCFVEHYPIYKEDFLEHRISEFIVGCNPPEVALSTYEKMYCRHHRAFSSMLWCARTILSKLERGSPLWTRALTLYVVSQAEERVGWNMLKANTQNIFEDILFEDSYLLNITRTGNQISCVLDMALSKKHKKYKTPKRNKPFYYQRGLIRFKDINSVNWTKEISYTYSKSNGSIDRKNIDTFSYTAGKYHLEGDWGELTIQSPSPILTWI